MKRVVGQRTQRVVEVEEEGKEDGEEEASATKDVGTTEKREDVEKSVLAIEEEETINPRPLDSGDGPPDNITAERHITNHRKKKQGDNQPIRIKERDSMKTPVH
ncbi:hypothetical protein NDU88_001669 [Pleurodeles waltl]|uniref:Uncharacterized protein n=1 Tax=Pleurodeles waltl TaxID=8319 RepID=A0AAV7P4V7_PLEWA|nr:hypothetical protein NDU88_001669 [Pleurodeles waltl]